jgi:hypothetical protein
MPWYNPMQHCHLFDQIRLCHVTAPYKDMFDEDDFMKKK